jgi:hypothetical protein
MRLALLFAVILVLGLPASGQQDPFRNLSERAGMVILTAIRETQQRGTDTMDVNDLIVALIIEDQEPLAAFLFGETPPGVPTLVPGGVRPSTSVTEHEPFLSPRVAIGILVKMNGILPRSKSLPSSTKMQTSAALNRVLDAARQLPPQLHQGEVLVRNSGINPPGMYQAVVPLDLLAAALREPCEGTKMLQEAGITEEKVLQTIRAGGDLEKGSSSKTP